MKKSKPYKPYVPGYLGVGSKWAAASTKKTGKKLKKSVKRGGIKLGTWGGRQGISLTVKGASAASRAGRGIWGKLFYRGGK
ncbi:MAG: hypothetical protein RQ743_14675 [Bacteroidales bacterium]|nr:hypothetical protein [Bacteroidales bacterium]